MENSQNSFFCLIPVLSFVREPCVDFLELLSDSCWSFISEVLSTGPDTIEHFECFDLISIGVCAGGLSERYPEMKILIKVDETYVRN